MIRRLLLGVTAAVISAVTTYAAEIRLEGKNADGISVVSIRGDFIERDIDRFADVTKDLDDAIISFSSDGGNLSAGIEIGTRIRLRGYRTVVADREECYSACALAWLGGTTRYVGSGAQVGFHAAYLRKGDSLQETGVGNAVVGGYAANLGLRTPAIIFLTSAPPDGFNLLTENVVRELGILAEFSPPSGLLSVIKPDLRQLFDVLDTSQDPNTLRRNNPFPLPRFQKAVFYEEDLENPSAEARATAGNANWKIDALTENETNPFVQAVVQFSAVTMTMTIRRNVDLTLSASHTIELLFESALVPNRAIRDIGLLQLKEAESIRGAPLAGRQVALIENAFLIGLSNVPRDVHRNMQLLTERNWIDIPIRFEAGNRAIVSFEMGSEGSAIMQRAFEIWQQPVEPDDASPDQAFQ